MSDGARLHNDTLKVGLPAPVRPSFRNRFFTRDEQAAYYRQRETATAECDKCGMKATRRVWVAGKWVGRCERHASRWY